MNTNDNLTHTHTHTHTHTLTHRYTQRAILMQPEEEQSIPENIQKLINHVICN